MIIAHLKQIPVEVLDVFSSDHEQLASVRALEGKPFVGGDQWPVWTAYTTARIQDLAFEDCPCVLPEQSCPACRALARVVYGKDEV